MNRSWFRALSQFFCFGFVILGATTLNYSALALPQANPEIDSLVSQATNQLVNQSSTPLNCRFGYAALGGKSTEWLETIGTGWYVNFSAHEYSIVANNDQIEHVPIIKVKQEIVNGQYIHGAYLIGNGLSGAAIEPYISNLVTNNPGQLWLVGNEPDVPSPAQGNTEAETYAMAYEHVYRLVKQYDPSAQVGIGGISMTTPARMWYLTQVWDSYLEMYGQPMPIDVWNTHNYIINEAQYDHNGNIVPADGSFPTGLPANQTHLLKRLPIAHSTQECPLNEVYCRAEHDSIPLFIEHLYALRTWMKERGQQDKPLIITEFGLAYPYILESGGCFLADEFGNCFTPQRVNNFLNTTYSYMKDTIDTNVGDPSDNYRLVQQWLWFSSWVEPEHAGSASNLLEADYKNYAPGDINALTEVGTNMRNIILSYPTDVNLKAERAPGVVLPTSGTANISVQFVNNGDTSITMPFDVTFYSNSGLTNEIGSATINPILRGCARHTYTASVDWLNLPSGLHKFWVKLDSGNVVSENNESSLDNVIQGIVIVDGENVYLPSVSNANP